MSLISNDAEHASQTKEVSIMAVLDTFRSVSAATPRGLVSTFFASTFGALAEWNDARVTRKALSQLTARELDDIGLIPADIERIARR